MDDSSDETEIEIEVEVASPSEGRSDSLYVPYWDIEHSCTRLAKRADIPQLCHS